MLHDTERRYSQIEKEALVLVWACEKVADYFIGMSFVLETDHKPLVPLLGKMNLNSLTPRFLRTAPSSSPATSHIKEDIVTESIVQAITSYLPAYTDRLNKYRRAQHENSIRSHLITFYKDGLTKVKSQQTS